MKIIHICPICEGEFVAYESENRGCCSYSCARALRSIKRADEREWVMPVDEYFNTEIYTEPAANLTDATALFATLDYDEYDNIYGVVDDAEDIEPTDIAPFVYNFDSRKKNAQNAARRAEKSGSLIVLYECSCEGDKMRHHVDYGKPLEVAMLCRKCHGLAHRKYHAPVPAVFHPAA